MTTWNPMAQRYEDASDTELVCLDGPDGCQGAVELRPALSPTGIPYPRCVTHWDARLEIQRGINERYPEHAPADFDPLYAGEHWDENY